MYVRGAGTFYRKCVINGHHYSVRQGPSGKQKPLYVFQTEDI